jgi:23S rRNA pseudouridine1911/1915/1917 synthase
LRTEVRDRETLLDALVRLFPDSSKTTLRQMLAAGRVRVNGEVEKNAKTELGEGDRIAVGQKTEAEDRQLPPELQILHEDSDIIVVFKAHGLLTVPTEREREATAQAYLNTYLGARAEDRIHVVHRLDRETSGVLVFAKNFHARERLKEQFAEHTSDRLYVAIIQGQIKPPDGTISSNLLERRDLKMVSVEAHPDSKFAVTHYRTIATKGPYSMLEVQLETGRKNQIRDTMYGSTINPLGRLGLHAKLLGFVHPTTGKRMTFTVPLPKPFRELFRMAQM